ncbi:MAG: amino acid ABC transporter permease [bacterium]
MTDSPDFWTFSTQVVLPRIGAGFWLTAELTVLAGVMGLVLGLALALARLSRLAPVRNLARAYIALFRGTPLLLQISFTYFALPPLVGVTLDSFPAGVLALGLNAGAYFAEILRAAIESIDRGQMEAARALGMSRALAMRRIILPQTYRRLIPPIVNELAALSKDTSLVSVISLSEALYATQRLAAAYLRPWEVYGWAALGYLTIVLVLGGVAARLEARLGARES